MKIKCEKCGADIGKQLASIGGKTKSPARAKASAANGKLGGRPSHRKKMMESFLNQAKMYDNRGDIVLQQQASQSWRELATAAEAKKAPAYLLWAGRK